METWDDFVRMVKLRFNYLESEFDFRLVSQQAPFVVYESTCVRVGIFLDQRGRRELDLNISDSSDFHNPRQSLSIDSLLTLRGDEGQRKGVRPSYDHDSLDAAVEELAGLLAKHGRDLLHGDLAELTRLRLASERRTREMYPRH